MVSYRAGYHHGDARAALVRAAFDLARGGGPPTVTLRAAAREVGITAAAVYRHFTTVEELLTAVKCRALLVLAERMDSGFGSDSAFDRGPDPARDPRPHTALDPGPGRDSDPVLDPDPAHDSDPAAEPEPEPDFDSGPEHHRTPADVAAVRHRIRVVAEAYVSFAREYPGLFAMACHGGVEAAVALVAERVGDVPHPTGLAVWSAAHGVAVLNGSEADQMRVLDLVLSGIVP